MFQLNIRVKLFVILLFLLTIDAPPPLPPPPGNPPTLRYAPSLDDEGLRDGWRGWDPVDLRPSKLEDYVKKQSKEMHDQNWKGVSKPINMPHCIASLYIPKEGVYSVSDYRGRPFAKASELHQPTHAIFMENSLRLGSHSGRCAEIQALDAYHAKFPEKNIPPGACIAIWSDRDICRAPKLMRACSKNCNTILQANRIKHLIPPKKAARKPDGPNASSLLQVKESQSAGEKSTAAASSSKRPKFRSVSTSYWPDPNSPRAGQKWSKFSDVYNDHDVAQILRHDVPQGDAP